MKLLPRLSYLTAIVLASVFAGSSDLVADCRAVALINASSVSRDAGAVDCPYGKNDDCAVYVTKGTADIFHQYNVNPGSDNNTICTDKGICFYAYAFKIAPNCEIRRDMDYIESGQMKSPNQENSYKDVDTTSNREQLSKLDPEYIIAIFIVVFIAIAAPLLAIFGKRARKARSTSVSKHRVDSVKPTVFDSTSQVNSEPQSSPNITSLPPRVFDIDKSSLAMKALSQQESTRSGFIEEDKVTKVESATNKERKQAVFGNVPTSVVSTEPEVKTLPASLRSVFSKYALFDGRANRSEYWYFVLFCFVCIIVARVLGSLIYDEDNLRQLPSAIFIAGVLCPFWAVQVRRLHDMDKTGWIALLVLVPFGNLVLLGISAVKGTVGENQYGPSTVSDCEQTVTPARAKVPSNDRVPTASPNSIIDELSRYASLHEKGALSDAEFQKIKNRLISKLNIEP